MFTLIKREIEDHLLHFLVAATLSATLVVVLIQFAATRLDETVGVLISLGMLILVGCCAMGAAQELTDRANKISPFLATLAVTRGQILAARITVGVLTILTALVPIVTVAVILLYKFLPPIVFYWRAIVGVSVTAFLVALSCYGFGLLLGSTSRRLPLVAGCLVVPPLMLVLVLMKGFGYQTMIVLGLLILASVGRITARLSSIPL